MDTSIALILVIYLVLLAKMTNACGGFKLDIDYLKNCNSNNVVELSNNFNIDLTSNCRILIDGCFTIHNNITTAEIDYNVQKDTIKRSGKKDVCHQLDNKSHDIEMGLELLGLPKSCPIIKGTTCFVNKSINVSKYKLHMNVLVGQLKAKSLMTTNSGKSCSEFSAKFSNAQHKSALPNIGLSMIG